ncbi:uncharacterized protein LOC126093298 [Schistocerca cancellata]|uniref:uncharacterized protein LOC126093298 n=1 Tax=Schistocerca cancellata TaxID=274614 RepID=UPI002117C178|nr:uncharacterized protein LOC126093298 [Schistocerca cancellata]
MPKLSHGARSAASCVEIGCVLCRTKMAASGTDVQSKLALLALLVLNDAEIHATERRRKKEWTKNWIKRRNAGKGVLSMLHKELRIEDRTSFANFIRMDVLVFEELLRMVSPLIQKKDTVMRQAITARERLAVTLRFLATGNTYKDLAYSTRIANNTLSRMIPETLMAIASVLGDNAIQCPRDPAEWKVIEDGFHSLWQFPHCIGALDGKHVKFRPLRSDGSSFRNYKGHDSIVLLALVDANYKFLFVDIGRNGRMNDGAIFRESALFMKLMDGSLNLPPKSPLPGSDICVPYMFVADDAFALKENLMKPYPERDMTPEKRIFNYRICRARRVVENAFGIMSNKFRILLQTIPLSVSKVELITKVCCLLHNFVLARNSQGYIPPNVDELPCLPGIATQGANHSAASAREVRPHLTWYFNTVGRVPWQERCVQEGNR